MKLFANLILKLTILVPLFTLHSSLFTIYAQDVSFYQENITMKIEPDFFYVSGTYYLRTVSDSSIVLFYPFPLDSLYGEVDTLLIFNLNTNTKSEPLENRPNGSVFRVSFGNEKETAILISYRQKLLGNRAEYILTTTASWRKPLEQADYQLIVPDSLHITSFSYTPDKSQPIENEIIYYWSRRNFMPDRNMVVGF